MGVTRPGETRHKVFELVKSRILAGVSPTVREVQDALGFQSIRTAQYHLERLVAEGRLALAKGKARGYRLPDQAEDTTPVVLVPLLGRVQAGELTLASEELEEHIPVRTRRPDRLFALRVRGESMTGAGILPGDVVVVRRQPVAESGEVVVALIGDEATVKTLRRKDRRLELHPENPDFEPIFPDEQVTILGKVIEVRRNLE